MNAQSPGPAPTSRAVDALMELDEQGGRLCPPDTDAYIWAGDILHDLARVAELLDSTARRVTGAKNSAIERHAHALATALDAQGNLHVLHRRP